MFTPTRCSCFRSPCLFSTPLTTTPPSSEPLAVNSISFDAPVLDFAVVGDKVLVALDSTWQGLQTAKADPNPGDATSQRVKAVRLVDGGIFEVRGDQLGRLPCSIDRTRQQ